MKAFVCDICGKKEPPSSFELPGDGWYYIARYNPRLQQAHACSTTCLRAYATKEQQDEREQQHQQEAIASPVAPPPAPAFTTGAGETDVDAVAAASERQEY